MSNWFHSFIHTHTQESSGCRNNYYFLFSLLFISCFGLNAVDLHKLGQYHLISTFNTCLKSKYFLENMSELQTEKAGFVRNKY